ncbi:hypothetical protein Ab1vBOLIVR5_gp116c [Agrobacterium phage OLIVR5]|uniref:Receptor-recognising protein Gp38 domain-containing protein n=1 Tax=Agrobacterium phage OLIVR5 TaxID=2723773 RepID=A0A858MSL9_9CAUD|nr:hypothetical protein KNU99_gp116 [Agrobacterium phage OLIVR5]QIW87764.1 hypothetical protein Ab1vBOLIVR5_gp116c [Agrobacterium phage OLIVR5]
MVLPTSGPLSATQIAAEFRRPSPVSLSSFYGANPALPTSGAIKFSDFYGLNGGILKTITGNKSATDLRDLLTEAEAASNLDIRLEIKTGALAYSDTLGRPAINIANNVGTGKVTVIVEPGASVYGHGGQYGWGSGNQAEKDGKQGGAGISIFRSNVEVVNNGTIAGGGGGGGAGGVGGRGGSGYYWERINEGPAYQFNNPRTAHGSPSYWWWFGEYRNGWNGQGVERDGWRWYYGNYRENDGGIPQMG